MWANEIVVAAKQLDMIIKSILPATVSDRAASEICRALPDSQVQPFDEGRVNCRGVLGLRQRLLELPRTAYSLPSLNLDDSVVPPCLEPG